MNVSVIAAVIAESNVASTSHQRVMKKVMDVEVVCSHFNVSSSSNSDSFGGVLPLHLYSNMLCPNVTNHTVRSTALKSTSKKSMGLNVMTFPFKYGIRTYR